jgi:lipopolysaccharide transport protein LptA
MIGLIWSGSAWAAGAIQIESESMHMNSLHHRATFTGGVLLTRDDFELRCDKLRVDYLNNDIKQAVATGRVRMHQGVKHGASDKAVFEKEANRVTLMGHASVEDEKGVIRGYKIIHNITQGDTQVLQKQGEPVRLHIETRAMPQGKSHE